MRSLGRQTSDQRAPSRPPLTARTVMLAAVLMTSLLAAVVLTVVHRPGPLDERTLADQRNGLLRRGPSLPKTLVGVTLGGYPVVLLFLRTAPTTDDVELFAKALPARAHLRLVLQSPSGSDPVDPPAPVVRDPGQVLARAVDLPRPNDGGPGVGYAIIDSTRTVQYSTLDPSWATNGFEAATIIGATP